MQFNIQRFMQLIRRDWIIYKKPLIFVTLGSFILLGLISFISIIDSDDYYLHYGFWEGWYGVLLLGGGLLLTSVIFWEFKTPTGRVQYLSIPASNFEKTLSRGIYSLIFYPILVCIILGFLKIITDTFFPVPAEISKPDLPLWELFISYYLLHGIVFMFSIWLNKYVAPKTAIIGFLLIILGAIVFAGAHRIFFSNLYDGMFSISHKANIMPKPEFQTTMENIYPTLKVIVLIVIPAFFYTVAYFKMKEKVA